MKDNLRRAMNAAVSACGVLLANGSDAHHSLGMFEMNQTITVKGTVRVFEWTNPHAWVWLTVPNDSGGVDEWGVELAALSMIRRNGMTKDSFKAGDKVSMSIHPSKEGKGGSFIYATFEDGHIVGRKPGSGGPPADASTN
ncbi:MAG: DUF6152 family protein [Steroidobacteraceae bacterium]